MSSTTAKEKSKVVFMEASLAEMTTASEEDDGIVMTAQERALRDAIDSGVVGSALVMNGPAALRRSARRGPRVPRARRPA